MNKITVIGLGYVGLPLAIEFGKHFQTKGYDINSKRIQDLKKGIDSTLEVCKAQFRSSKKISFTNDINDIKDSNIYIVTVPTPVDDFKRPNLKPLEKSSRDVGSVLKKGDTVIYESTVYPGATEEFCVPILENESGLKLNKDFFCGYSPERINPGDKKHTLTNITKIVSGSNKKALKNINELYSKIIKAGIHKAPSIKVAEAAKVIENTQRDVNIALINELSMLFAKLNINSKDVFDAANTKWNFLDFRPGLVGGHCIGVDPYYLTHKAHEIGFYPEMILAGRRTNDLMSDYLVNKVFDLMIKKNIKISNARFLVMGLTFKEDCPDVRNTKVTDIVFSLKEYSKHVDIYDPWVSRDEIRDTYSLKINKNLKANTYDVVIIAVPHNKFKEMGINKIKKLAKSNNVIFDAKQIFKPQETDGSL